MDGRILRQGPYLVHGEQKREGPLSESGTGSGGLHDYQSDGGGGGGGGKQSLNHQQQQQTYLRSSRGQGRGGSGGRALSRQDTFDSETQGSRDSAYTEAGDSCIDMETDPYEEPDPYRSRHNPSGSQHHTPRQASWEDEGAEPDQENLNHAQAPSNQQQGHGRSKPRGRYCQSPTEGSANISRNQNQEEWSRDVYIR